MQRFSDKTFKAIFFICTPLTPLLVAAWVCFFYPWLENMENESFFCFLPSWMASFFAEPGGFSEFLARFFVQFFHHRVTMVVTVAHLAVFLFFAVAAYAKALLPQGGKRLWWRFLPGVVLFVPFWWIAFRDLPHFNIAIGYWLNLLAVWASLPLCRSFSDRKSVAWRWLLFLVISVFMAYLTGPLSLMYVSLMGILCLARKWAYGLGFLLSGFGLWCLTAWFFSIMFVYPLQSMLGLTLLEKSERTDFRLQRVFYKSEKLADHQQWRALTDMASAYFDEHPNPSADADWNQLAYREQLAENLKLALLKNGLLNRRFFSYSDIYEMNMMLPGNSVSGEYNFSNMRFAWHLGLFVPMRIYTNNTLNVEGLQNATISVIIPNAIFLGRYDLAGNYNYFLQHTLFYGKQARRWRDCNSLEKSEADSFFFAQRHNNNLQMQEEPGTVLDGWVFQMYSPNSGKELLEYHTFLKLFYKDLDSLPSLVQHYRRLGYKTLPDYVQEGLLILQNYEPERGGKPQKYADYEYSPVLLNEYKRFRRSQKLHQMERLKVTDVQKMHGTTYSFHYHFRRFIY